MMKNQKFIPVAEPELGGNEKKYILDCLDTNWISSKGKYIEKFEDAFAKYIGSSYSVSSSNGTTALHLALLALGIKKRDEVIVPNLTFIASANVVVYAGAKPILVDVEEKTWNIDPNEIERNISKNTKVIMAVHLYGHPADMNSIMGIAKKYNLTVLEDAAEAHGAEVLIGLPKNWKKVGSIGEIGCFSFYGNKIITTGEGGMIVTDNKQFADKMRILRDHGQHPQRRYYHTVVGYNYRMTNLQAAIGLAQLERIKKFIEKKRVIANFYTKKLKNVKGITLPPDEKWAKNVYWMYSIIVDKPFTLRRNELMEILRQNNIETRPFFYPVSYMPPYKNTAYNDKNAEYLSKHGINLPSSVTLNNSDIERICTIIKKYAV